VNGQVDDVKAEYSQDYVPLHPSLTEVVLEWSKDSVPTEENWVFANPVPEQPSCRRRFRAGTPDLPDGV
jgi:hypothetical protein